MRESLKYIPIPIGGLMLSLATLGNLLSKISIYLRWFLFAISFLLFMLLMMKLFLHWNQSKLELDNPVIFSVFPTVTMTIIIFSTYVSTFSLRGAKFIWLLGVLAHIALMMIYTLKILLRFNLKIIYPSIFIVYVGIVAGSVAAPAVDFIFYGKVLFWIGLFSYITLIHIIIYRLLSIKNIQDKTAPLLIVMAAPSNLCLAGYISCFKNPNMTIIFFLFILSIIMNIYACITMFKYRKISFSPSFSALTFPLVIGALATRKVAILSGVHALEYLASFQTILAVIVVVIVFFKYSTFLYSKFSASDVLIKKTY